MGDVAMLRQINHSLMPLEYRTAPDVELTKPLLFVIGPPRSGTTITTQILAYGLLAGYITNIAARFWNAPTLGVRVSRQVLGDDPAADLGEAFFGSEKGQTRLGGGIHEFGYFWRSMCWDSPALHKLPQIQDVLDKPLVMKGIYPARYASLVRERLGPQVKFVMVERPFCDVYESIRRCAVESGEPDFWFRGWELPPHKEARLSALPIEDRLAARAYYWQHYCALIADYRLQLPTLCTDTDLSLEALAMAVDGLNEYRSIPDSVLEYHGYEIDHDHVPWRDDALVSLLGELCEDLT